MTAEPRDDIADHEQSTADPQGHARCAACGYRWPCPDVRSRPRPLEPAEYELLHALDLDVGYGIRRRVPDGAEHADGGVIVGVHDDDEGRTWFRVLDFPHGRHRYHQLCLDDIEPASVSLPDAAVMRTYARRLAAWVGRQRGAATGEELDALSTAVTLTKGGR